MRDRLKNALGSAFDDQPVSHSEFLVYLMGAYKAWTPDDFVAEDAEVDPEDLGGPFAPWDEGSGDYTEEDAKVFMQDVRDKLRREAGVNAFLAVDPAIPTDEMNAAKQSIEFAKCANLTAFVIPFVGKNIGVGIEVGSVLQGQAVDQERIVFLHESGVSSAMIRGLSREWDVAVYSFEDTDELVYHLRQFIVRTIQREQDPDDDLNRMR
jgi:hypothetical protein